MTAMFWPVVCFMALTLAIGLYTYTLVRGSSRRFTMCGKSMPFLIIGTALLAQAVDGNATMGNTSLIYMDGFWSGAAIPLGLALSLFIVGRYLAAPLNRMNLLTLPEFFFRRYGKGTEAMVSVLTVISFTIVVAGNLAAVAWLLSMVSGFDYLPCLAVGTAVIVVYTMAGGLYSALWTDFLQIHIALVGFVAAAGWLLWTQDFSMLLSRVPVEKLDFSGLTQIGSGALLNWSFILSLAFGNAMALDFMERVFAAKSPGTAKVSCYYAGWLTLLIGGCACVLGIASMGLVTQVEDPRMVMPALLIEHIPYWMAVLVVIGVLGASMSTANGAMLVISVVIARNGLQRWKLHTVKDSTMLSLSRLFAIPVGFLGACMAYIRPEPGILLVIAFDIVLAGCVAPLFFGVYWGKANKNGAIASILVGTTSRLILQFAVPEAWAGLETLIPPALGTTAFVTMCLWRPETVSRHVSVYETTDSFITEAAEG
jgi:solute:Na+ symporter, SSS family